MDPPAIKRLAEIKCPTMVVVGDSYTEDIRKLAQQLAREIPGARLETVDNSAHLPNLEHPAQFNQRLDSFLATLRKKPAPT
jgi:pimeloyl-ACP methyl ester carboxylesterase